MSLSRRRPPVVYDQRIEYIDPWSHPSAVGYRISKTAYGYFEAELELISCDRKIHWQFENRSEHDFKCSVRKIDNAINLLQDFRASFIEHGKKHPRRRKRK